MMALSFLLALAASPALDPPTPPIVRGVRPLVGTRSGCPIPPALGTRGAPLGLTSNPLRAYLPAPRPQAVEADTPEKPP